MTSLLQRPILIGGLGLTLGAYALSSIDSTLSHWGGTFVWGAIALGSGVWWLKQRSETASPKPLTVLPVDRTMVDKALALVESRINQLAAEIGTAGEETEPVLRLRQQLTQLGTAPERQTLQLSVMGGKAVGKTTLTQLLQTNGVSNLSIQQTVSLATSSSTAEAQPVPDVTDITSADVVLFVTTGDLTDSEFQTVQQLIAQNHRVLLVFNKQDQYLPDDRPVILQQLRERMQAHIPAEDIVAIAAQPALVKVRQHQVDGTIQERVEQPAPELEMLQTRLTYVLSQQRQQLILATVLRQAQALNRAVQAELNQVRRTRALPLIEQYQWVAAAAAFANPVASLDLLATASINAQLLVDLGAIYQQQFSLEQAKTIMGTLASQMVKLGLVEMASQAIAPLLKSHALTYVAGGTLQGISAAYLTRLAGLSLIEFFEEQNQLLNPSGGASFQIDRLVQKLTAVFQDNQRAAFVQTLVKQGISRLVPPSTPASVSS